MEASFVYLPNKRKPSNQDETPPKRLKTDPQCSKYRDELQAAWSVSELLAELESLRPKVAENIVQLFEQDNTIPFICRYRRHLVGNLDPDRMREIKSTIGQIAQLRAKVATVGKSLERENVLTSDLRESICKVKSIEELNHIYELYKPARKKSLVEKATNLGLCPVAEMIVSGSSFVNFSRHVNTSVGPLSTENEVRAGVGILVSSMFMKSAKVLDFIRENRKTSRIEITSSQAKAKTSGNPTDSQKYELYFNFKSLVSQIRPHQVLAINRGEKNKILMVKIVIPDEMRRQLEGFVLMLYRGDVSYTERTEFLKKVIGEMYSKKVVPLITKEVRRELTEKAEKASIEVFANNLRQLLLMCPVKGEKILGIDPGFSHGCKLAMISEQGSLLETLVVYPHTRRPDSVDAKEIIAETLRKHRCRIVALGNGTACRETEALLVQVKKLAKLDFTYCITNEQGASVYSCSDAAKREFPDLDVNLISAVSIARRLGNPLAELVKVEPKHLGVGMYQHDVGEKQLAESLQEIVVECVSFVGVDVNTASETLLQFVAGLTPARARNIIEYSLSICGEGARMKFFLVIVASVLLGAAFGQEPTNNPLRDAEFIIYSYHRMYEGTKDNVRFYMADSSRLLIDDLMVIVTAEIESWNSRSASCANWTPRNTEAIGNALRDCAMQSAQTIYDIHNNVYDEVEAMQQESVQLQFSVMRSLRDFNILENYNDFVEDFQSVVQQAYERLEHHFVPRLEDALEVLLSAENTLPGQTQTCVNAISRKFSALC